MESKIQVPVESLTNELGGHGTRWNCINGVGLHGGGPQIPIQLPSDVKKAKGRQSTFFFARST